MDEQTILEAHVLCRKMFTALTELQELTTELANALQRQDQVSVKLFLGMRRDALSQLTAHDEALRRKCALLPPSESQALRRILNGQEGADTPSAQALERTVRQNRQLLAQITSVDERINRRLGGKDSFYEKRAAR